MMPTQQYRVHTSLDDELRDRFLSYKLAWLESRYAPYHDDYEPEMSDAETARMLIKCGLDALEERSIDEYII